MISSFGVFTRKIIAVIDNTKARLAILEPITFQRAIFELSLINACILTKSSGAEVAKDTIVTPITILDKLKYSAVFIDPLTSNSPPKNNKKNPAKKVKKISISNLLNQDLSLCH